MHGPVLVWHPICKCLSIIVEVGSVCGLNCHKPMSSSIRKPNSPRNIIPSIADLYIYIYIYTRFVLKGNTQERIRVIPINLVSSNRIRRRIEFSCLVEKELGCIGIWVS